MNALTDGFGEPSMSTTLLIILSVLLAIVIVAVLAAALIRIRVKLEATAARWPRWPRP